MGSGVDKDFKVSRWAMQVGQTKPFDAAIGVAVKTILVVNLILLAYYVCRGYLIDFHSDSALKNLLSQEMIDTRSVFPSQWNYVNGDLWILFGQMVVVPLALFLPNGFALHAVSGLVFSALILWGVWLVSGIATPSRRIRLAVLAVFASGISWQGAENLYGQVSYGSVVMVACFLLYFAWRSVNALGRRGQIGWMSAFFILCLLAVWSNPQRAVAYYLLPLVAAIGSLAASGLAAGYKQSRDLIRKCLEVGVLLALAAVGGVVLHKLTMATVNDIPGVGATRWLSIGDMIGHIEGTLYGLLAILGGIPTPERFVMSKMGLTEAVRFLGSLAVLGTIPVALLSTLRSPGQGPRFVATFAALGLAMFVFLQIATSTPDMRDPGASARYMVPSLLFSLIVLVVSMTNSDRGPTYRVGVFALTAMLATSAFLPSNPFSRAIFGNPVDPRVEMAHYLEEQGLGYGYATYWNAGALTAIADQRVKVRGILIDRGMPSPFRHLGSDRWYMPQAWSGKSFLMLTDAEVGAVDWAAVQNSSGEPVEKLRHNNFNIYVYDHNLAATLPHWGSVVDERLVPSAQMLHQVGAYQIVDQEPVMVASQGEVGFLHFGPYVQVMPGHYKVVVDLEVTEPHSADAGFVDVVADSGALTLASQRLTRSGRQRLVLDITPQKRVGGLEVRVWTGGTSNMVLRSITIQTVKNSAALTH